MDLNLEEDLLVMGSGRCRWGRTEEWEYYPGIEDSLFQQFENGPTDQWSVWTLDPRDLDAKPQPLGDCRFGTARAVACRKLDGINYCAVGTPEGIFLHDGSTWQSIADEAYSVYGLQCWGLQMTKRGALYAVLARDPGSTTASGCYRLSDVRGALDWQFLGDDTPLDPQGLTMSQTGSSGNLGFAYLSAIEGEGSEPDILFLSGRAGSNDLSGLYRAEISPSENGNTCTWMHKAWKESDDAFWQKDEFGNWSALDPGWVTLWAGQIDFQPMISRMNPDCLLISFQGRLHRSEDGGHHWTQCYTDVTAGFAHSRGFDELVSQGIDYLSDGRVVLGCADLGTLISEDASLDGFRWFYPELDRETTYDTDAAYNRETADIEVRQDWQGSGEDALFILCSDLTHHGAPSKIMLAPPGESFNWTNITRSLNTENKFIPAFCFAGDSVVFAPFLESDIAWGAGASLAHIGVLRGEWQAPDQWQWTEHSTGLDLPIGWNASGRDILHHEASGRIFLATEFIKTPGGDLAGGIFMLESRDDPDWELVFGLEGDWRNFQCLAQSEDGSRLYAGSQGPGSMGDGGVFRCPDPFNAPQEWEVIANDTRGDFGFGIPFYGEDWSDLDASRNLTDVRSLCVDPDNPDIVYAGLSSYRFLQSMGLWVFNREGDERWSYLFYDSPIEHQGVHRLKFHPLRTRELGICTAGIQFWSLDTDSLDFTGVGDPPAPNSLRLLGLEWNGNSASIRFAMREPAALELEVFDPRGRRVFHREISHWQASEGQLRWFGGNARGKKVASGVYFLRLRSGHETVSGKLILLR